MFTVGIDTRGMEPGFKAHYGRGIGRYAKELTEQFEELGLSSDGINKCRMVKLSGATFKGAGWEEKLLNLVPFGKLSLESQLLLPRRIKSWDLDAVHFLAHGDATARCPLPYFVTVLDLIPLKFPELYQAGKPNWRFSLARRLEHLAIEKATGVFAISECTKRDLVQLLNVPEDKVCVTPLAVGDVFGANSRNLVSNERRGECSIHLRCGISANRPLLIYVGGIDPRKNISFLLSVMAELVRNQPQSSIPQLVIVGAYEQDMHYPELITLLKRLELEREVKLPGYLSDAELLELYGLANALVFPSLYEGFGLPVLEAMSCGLPVIAGNNSSIPEVAGDSALLVEDHNLQAWVQAIVDLLSSTELSTKLSIAGKSKAAEFSWKRTAEATLEGYKHFYQKSQRVGEA